ncbi:MAG TPA: alpha/beta fold hydrolase [Candidatus Binataceae bacterium]|nr:alpha/beta fold hydrolase [Candidatus Binataceae bacterium]
MSNTTTGYATSNGAKLYFEVCGEGPALVFIHAGVSDHRMWDPQVEAFASKFKVIRYDLRGFGKSTMPKESFALRDDLLAVLRHLGIDRAALVGCSMGGATAIDFTLEHPEMVTALVPVGAGVSGWNDWSEESGKLMAEMTSAVRAGDTDAAFEISARYWIDGPSRDASRVDPTYRERSRMLHRQNFSLELFQHNEVPLNPPAIERLGEIKCPTMVVIGDSDAQDLRKVAQHLAAEISGATLMTIADGAHLPSLEHPMEFDRLLAQFLVTI